VSWDEAFANRYDEWSAHMTEWISLVASLRLRDRQRKRSSNPLALGSQDSNRRSGVDRLRCSKEDRCATNDGHSRAQGHDE
jgi:hypothetical protein